MSNNVSFMGAKVAIPLEFLLSYMVNDTEMAKISKERLKKIEALFREIKEEEKHKGEKAPDKCE